MKQQFASHSAVLVVLVVSLLSIISSLQVDNSSRCSPEAEALVDVRSREIEYTAMAHEVTDGGINSDFSAHGARECTGRPASTRFEDMQARAQK